MRVICTRYGYLNGILSGTSFILIFGSYCISLWVGTNFVISGTMQGGVVITVFITLMLSIGHIDMVSPMLAQLGKAQGAAGILFEIIDRVTPLLPLNLNLPFRSQRLMLIPLKENALTISMAGFRSETFNSSIQPGLMSQYCKESLSKWNQDKQWL